MRAYLRQARKINKGKVKDVRAIYPKVNRKFANPFVLPSYSKRLLLNLFTNLLEVSEPFVDVQELAPFGV
jgi:hypothetical protein